MAVPSYFHKSSWAAFSVVFFLTLGDTLTFSSGVTVSRPQSKALS